MNFEQILPEFRAGKRISNREGSCYAIVDGEVFCFPEYLTRPNFKYKATRLFFDAILDTNWKIV